MISKSYTKTGRKCRVTFRRDDDGVQHDIHLVGDFNDWDQSANPMTRRKDGSHSLTLSLDADREYRFRYLIDGERWENDAAADDYVANEHGSDDSVVRV